MKLLRLTSDDADGFFNCDYNDGIEIEPDSKVALQSVAANMAGGDLTISAANSRIDWQIKDGYAKTAYLKDFVYNAANNNLLLEDIENTINNRQTFEVGLNKILGIEWNASIGEGEGKSGKTLIQYQIGKAGEYYPDAWNIATIGLTRASTNGGTWGATAGLSPTNDFNRAAVSKEYVSRGVGYIRCRIGRQTNTGTASNGFMIGLTRNPEDPGTFEERDCSYGIRVDMNGASVEYKVVQDGVATLSPTTPSPVVPDSNNNDYLEITTDGAGVDLNVYQGVAATKTTMATYAYNNEKLYPFIVFFGSRTATQINSVRLTPSPFNTEPAITQQPIEPQDGLSAPPQPPPNQNPTNNLLQFESSIVSGYLGYDHPRIPQFGFLNADEPEFLSANIFSEGFDVNGYLIQFFNLNMDSYDSLTEQRENILAIIPNGDSMGNLVYSPPTPYFLDIRNKNKLTIRNLKARIVRVDYSPLTMEGLGQIILLIKDNTE